MSLSTGLEGGTLGGKAFAPGPRLSWGSGSVGGAVAVPQQCLGEGVQQPRSDEEPARLYFMIYPKAAECPRHVHLTPEEACGFSQWYTVVRTNTECVFWGGPVAPLGPALHGRPSGE